MDVLKKKSAKLFMLAAIVGGLSLATFTTSADAAEIPPKVIEFLSEDVEILSGISYIDATGHQQEIPIPQSAQVKVYSTSKEIRIEFNSYKYRLTNIKEITFKNVNVVNKAALYSDTVTKLTMDGVNFERGVNISIMRKLKTLIVKNDSYFGDTSYSLAVHSCPYLVNLVMDRSTFNADVRIYSNAMLGEGYITNSILRDDTTQYSNQPSYRTVFVNNRFERPKTGRSNRSGGKSARDIFYINPQPERSIANTGYIGAQQGTIKWVDAYGNVNERTVPAYLGITSIVDNRDRITIKLQNGVVHDINGATELEFKNVYFRANISFVSRYLRLESINFVNCKTQAIAIANSETLQKVEMHGTEVSQSSGYFSVYNNSVLTRFVVQDSSIRGTSGYTSVYRNLLLEDFILNDSFFHGYVYTKDIGQAVLQISNSQFNDYLSSTSVIEGEADRQWIEEL